jgi:membrane protease YdiL (CAAX protease family)
MATTSEHLPLTHLAERYWSDSRRPLASLVFVAPMLLAYELGVVYLGVQNGADAFMRRVLDLFGFGQHFLLPILTVCILLGWHYLSRGSWRLSGGIISGMAIESLALAICLRLILSVQDVFFHAFDAPALLAIGGKLKEAIGFLGAGIYEELLFRLILLSLVAWALRCVWARKRETAHPDHSDASQQIGQFPRTRGGVTILAIVLTSLLFAAAHNVGPGGEPLQGFRFLFRTLAGVFFSIIFIYRGFGIAAGSHAAYDIIAGLM